MCAKLVKVSPLAPAGGFPPLPVIDGVRFGAAAVGVKYQDRTDVMLAELAPGTALAGVFTQSATRAAPVLDCQAKLSACGGRLPDGGAILVNSGNANVFTGQAGDRSVARISAAVAYILDLPQESVFTASTGVIGEVLPDNRIVAGLDGLRAALSPDGSQDAARAIMTTDTFAKGAAAEIVTEQAHIRISGFAKGSGMIAPDMATMLAYIFTDAAIEPAVLQSMLARANGQTFNCITVDSDTSTSDTLLVAATGRASNPTIASVDTELGCLFAARLEDVMLALAHQVVRDGEGASKFVEIAVTGAVDETDAKKVAFATANSPLVKTAIAGEDPNWGRIVMAVGKSGARADRDRLTIRFGDILVAERGWVSPSYREEAGAEYMKQQELRIAIDLGLGDGQAKVWTCDLSHGYISINADYRS